MSFDALGARARPKRREKLFGDGRPRPFDREAKLRLMHAARAFMRRTEAGKAYGAITAKALADAGVCPAHWPLSRTLADFTDLHRGKLLL